MIANIRNLIFVDKKIHPEEIDIVSNSDNPVVAFPLLGITLKGILKFVEQSGGKISFEELTTTEVCEKIVKVQTKDNLSSYCSMMKAENNIVRQATVFISHAWKFKFLNVLDALERHFPLDKLDSNGEEHVLWFDLFSNNQHGLDAPPPFEWWCDTFMNAIKTLGRVVMIMEPWENPIPLTRVWCLWEIYCASNTNCPFEVAMSAVESERFRHIVKTDYSAFHKMLGTVDVYNSEAWNPVDKSRIFEVITQTVGFTQLNTKVFECLRDWVIRDMISYISSVLITGNLFEIMDCKKVLGYLYSNMGLYHEAETVYEECIAIKQQLCAENDQLKAINFVDVTYYFATVLERNQKLDRATEYFLECIAVYSSSFGEKSRETLAAKCGLAGIYLATSRPRDAEVLYLDAMSIFIELEGEKNVDVMACLNGLGASSLAQYNYSESEDYYRRCFVGTKELVGDRHPLTLKSMSGLADALWRVCNFDEAIQLRKESLNVQKELFGGRHPDVIAAIHDLSLNLHSEERFEEAEVAMKECIALQVEVHGEEDSFAIRMQDELTYIFAKQHKYEEAAVVCEANWALAKKVLGEKEETTLMIMKQLCDMYDHLDRSDDSLRMRTEYLNLQREVLGGAHDSTLDTVFKLANANMCIGDYSESKRLYDEFIAVNEQKGDGENLRSAKAMEEIGSACLLLGLTEESFESYMKSLTLRKRLVGERHPDTLATMFKAASALLNMGKPKEAQQLLAECQNGQVQVFGAEDYRTIKTKHMLESIHVQ